MFTIHRNKRRYRPTLELLEDRIVPTIIFGVQSGKLISFDSEAPAMILSSVMLTGLPAGFNVLIGLDGNDLMIGGEGTDVLLAEGAGFDVLVGGETVYGKDRIKLKEVLDEWLAFGSTNLILPTHDPRLIVGDTVIDDGVVDTLLGSLNDWVIAS